jgi:sugar phosphate isomerase/epimerase
MKLGFCGGVDKAAEIKAWGYDYVELALAPLAALSDAAFAAARQTLCDSGLPCLACNVFLPGSVRVTGLAVDQAANRRYVEIALARAASLGAGVVVFGSSGARNLPTGLSGSQGLTQIIDFARMAAAIAEPLGITLVIEPLNATESNIINRVSEGLILVQAVNHPCFKVLADTYHMRIEHEDLTVLASAGSDLRHVHVSNLLGRKIPLVSDRIEHALLIQLLRSIKYTGHLSIEAGFRADQAAEACEALCLFRELTGE